MKISFPCHRCGNRLKAREEAVGRTRKCPVCSARVTCPAPVDHAPVVDAEIVDAEVVDAEVVDALVVATPPLPAARAGVGPYADLDDGGAYDVVGQGQGASALTEARRPCPMCGETILASAVKCRFCGEVFDPVLKKGKGKKSARRSSRQAGSSPVAARQLGVGILLTALGIGSTALSFVNAARGGKGQGRFFVFYGLVIGGILGIIKGIHGMMTSD